MTMNSQNWMLGFRVGLFGLCRALDVSFCCFELLGDGDIM